MKPLGIRFENFACFDECYVPLDAGVQVLVGKNNSGKTALLRGLTALTALPIGTAGSPIFNLSGYTKQTESPGFNFHVQFAFETGDFGLLGGAIGQSAAANNASKRIMDFEFRYIGVWNQVGFAGATLILDDDRFVILERQNQLVSLHQYNQIGQRVGMAQLRTVSGRQLDSGNWPILAPRTDTFRPRAAYECTHDRSASGCDASTEYAGRRRTDAECPGVDSFSRYVVGQ